MHSMRRRAPAEQSEGGSAERGRRRPPERGGVLRGGVLRSRGRRRTDRGGVDERSGRRRPLQLEATSTSTNSASCFLHGPPASDLLLVVFLPDAVPNAVANAGSGAGTQHASSPVTS